MKFYVLLTLLALRPASGLTGYQFEDNKSQNRFIAENGEMTFKLSRIPKQIAACFNLFVNFNRYSSIVPIMDFRTSYEKEYMDLFYGEFESMMK
jgi:hypothetical protein